MTPQPTHVDPNPHPTPEQAAAIAAAGGGAAGDASQQGKTAEQAQAETQAAMAAKAREEGVTLSDADVEKIAAGTIAMLEARGAFEQAPGSEQNAPPVDPNSAQDGNSLTSGNPPPEGSGSSPNASTPPSGPSEEPPRRKTFAERFQGKGK